MDYFVFDDQAWPNFFPLTLTRSTGDLRLGILKLRQRLLSFFASETTGMIVSEQIAEIYQERHPDWLINKLPGTELIMLNSRLRMNPKLKKKIDGLQINQGLKSKQGTVLAARIQKPMSRLSMENLDTIFSDVKFSEADESCWEYLWELIGANSDFIRQDFEEFFYEKDNFFDTETGVSILNPYNVWLGEGVELNPGVVIDAREGPVVIDENALIMANSVIVGPVYVGKKSIIKIGAKIYSGTSIGPVCKVGGEVEGSIFQGYSNKQHDGFLGHSFLGEWVNFGAGTSNSDLKNNYQQVKSFFYPENRKIDTGCFFLGTFVGDHTKTGINSTINTGSVIGVGCNLTGNKIISDHIPSFSWGTVGNLCRYEIEKFLETAGKVKKRRDLGLSPSESELFYRIMKLTQKNN